MFSVITQTIRDSFVRSLGRWSRAAIPLCLAVSCIVALSPVASAQSTFGTVLGTVKDPSGSFVPMAKVDLTNAGTSAVRSVTTKADGSYEFVNTEVGSYTLSVSAPGFQTTEVQPFTLTARQTARVDIDLKVATQATTVNVEAVSVVQTDVSNVAETKGSLELTDLPVAIGTRSSGSTSAYSTLTTQQGVQTDNSNNMMVAGAGPSSFRSRWTVSVPSDRDLSVRWPKCFRPSTRSRKSESAKR